MRITRNHLKAKMDIVNGMLGFDTSSDLYNVSGAVTLSGAYGGHAVHLYTGEHGGIRDLTGGHGTARECHEFLSGMIAALRMVR